MKQWKILLKMPPRGRLGSVGSVDSPGSWFSLLCSDGPVTSPVLPGWLRLTLSLSFCKLSLWYFYLDPYVYFWAKTGQQDARDSLLPRMPDSPCPQIRPFTLMLAQVAPKFSTTAPEFTVKPWTWTVSICSLSELPARCQPPQQTPFSQRMSTYPSLQLVLLLWQISPC